jgi:uncharacterized protein YndB with AHSA1/START domain
MKLTPASGEVRKSDGPQWTLVLVRELKHPPARVWDALTEPEHLKAWAPFDADGNLGMQGATVKLTTVGAPYTAEATIKHAEKPKLLEFNWGEQNIRWELEPQGTGTRLTLWASIDKRYIAMGAAGWHVCIETLDHLLAGDPLERMAGPAAMKDPNWQRLHGEYARLFKAEA